MTTPGRLARVLEALRFDEQGLIPAVIQDARSKQVLTLCYLSRQALRKCLQERKVYVFRRSKKRLMLKGETSGHIQRIKRIYVDCEGNSLLFMVKQHVAACHQGYMSCYFRRLTGKRLAAEGRRIFDPRTVYRRRYKGGVCSRGAQNHGG